MKYFKDLTTFRVGGKIKNFIEVKSVADIRKAVKFAKNNKLKIFILGGGSDILVSDRDFDGLVIKYTGKKVETKTAGKTVLVTAEAGLGWDELVEQTVKENLQGLECLSGIPGSVGASPIQNIGAYGFELKDNFVSLKAYDLVNNKFVVFDKEACEFGYRESFFKKPDNWQKYLILSVTLALIKNGKPVVRYDSLKKYLDEIKTTSPSLKDVRSAVLTLRSQKLENPDKVANAGSFFKNPIIDKSTLEKLLSDYPEMPNFTFGNDYKLFAGWLIEKAGWKGKSFKNAAVSSKNALVLVNPEGKATSKDILNLSKKIQRDVFSKFGINLEPEVQFIGVDNDINYSDYKKFQHMYPKFIYKNYKWFIKNNNLEIKYTFLVSEKIIFHPKLKFSNISKEKLMLVDKTVMDNLVFNLGLAEIPSYWKATVSPEIIIEAGTLDDYQISWWSNLLEKGMGQFFYENNIDFVSNKLFTIKSARGTNSGRVAKVMSSGLLISVGGGKDSAVTTELLKDLSDAACFSVNPTDATIDVVNQSKVEKLITVERTIDPLLLNLNSGGFLNGHTPFSSLIAFLSVFAAVIYGLKDVALSNERSSDEENTIYLGKKINHQYSKTLEFENNFREYNQMYLSNVNYFSFLRPLYEIQISKIFSGMNKYFPLIRSCNVGQKRNAWCCHCPKCLSTYILLYPFVGKEEILKIFPEDMFMKDNLYGIMESLILEDNVKPFECVGIREELKLALAMSIQAFGKNKLPSLLNKVKSVLGDSNTVIKDNKDILSGWGLNNLGSKYEKHLKQVQK